MGAINIKAYTDDASQIEAIKAVIKAFKIKYTITKTKEIVPNYNPEFVDKILQGDKDYEEGKGEKISLEELNNLWK